jgi:hypothetical protein
MDFPVGESQVTPIIRMSILTQQYLFNLNTHKISFGGSKDLFVANKVSIKSFHGTYLSGHPDGSVDLAYNIKDWEIWTSIWTGEDYIWFRSFHDTYLSARQDGTLTLVKDPKEWEQWTKIGNSVWKSYHGTYLSGEINMKVSLQPKINSW